MANHVHLVVTDCPDDGAGVRRIFKGVSQADLSKLSGEKRAGGRMEAVTDILHTEASILGAIQYVAEQEFKLVEIIDMRIVVPGNATRDDDRSLLSAASRGVYPHGDLAPPE